MVIYNFAIDFKLNRNQKKIIQNNIELYCDKKNIKRYTFEIFELVRKNIYHIEISIDNDDEDIKFVDMINFYLTAFYNGNEDKVF